MPEPKLIQTPSQTVGPFYGYALPYVGGAEVVPPWHPDAIRLHGTVLDGAGDPVPDAILEIWHADAHGNPIAARGSLERDGVTNTGFGRTPVNRAGEYAFSLLKPGGHGDHAPYVLVTVFARGLLHHLFTRAYFGDEEQANDADAFLGAVPADRRDTLIAVPDGDRGYRFDVRLQGEGETVFLDFGVAS